jgi:hypothetical protein
MGPNAIPVPEIQDGSLPQYSELEICVDNHFSSGDQTANLYTSLYIPLFSKRVGLNLSVVPIEYYEMDTATRDIRRARDYDGKGISGGDIYIGTFIQLIKDKKFPDVLLTINLKTASGTGLSAARFTDSPGYFFDVSVGKDIKPNSRVLKCIRPYVLCGFYSWQVNRDDNLQNDAFLYGAGVNLCFSEFKLKNHFGGYSGYLNNGDKPMVYRCCIESNLKKTINYKLQFQHGIHDFPYNSVRIGFLLNINKILYKP